MRAGLMSLVAFAAVCAMGTGLAVLMMTTGG